jgi:small subunit ribosomal protein S3
VDLTFNRTPEGTKVTLKAEQVGRVIGRRGKVIHELQRRLQEDFNLHENPQLKSHEIEESRLNAQVMASRLASSLERGWFFRSAGHSTAQNIMDAGARGCLIILSVVKLLVLDIGLRNSNKGHIKFCGETALEFMDTGFSTCSKET